MTYQELQDLLETSGIQFAFNHWENPTSMPYGVYFDDRTENFFADGIVYLVVRHFNIELYVRQRDPNLEARLETVLTDAKMSWDKDVTYIDSERFYKISYEVEG